MKKLLLLLFLLCSPPVYADYFGTSIGNSQLNYDVKGEAYDAINRDNGEYSGPVLALGGDIDVSVQDTSHMHKVFYGLQISRFFFVEFLHVNIGTFSAHGNVKLDYNNGDRFDTDIEYTISTNSPSNKSYTFDERVEAGYIAYAKVDGQYDASVSMKGWGLKLVGISPIGYGDGFSVMGGFGLIQSRTVMKTSYVYDIEYGYNADYPSGESYEKTHITGHKTTYEEQDLLIPVFNFGLLYDITGNVGIRMEWEKYGHPTNKTSIEVTSVGLQYNF